MKNLPLHFIYVSGILITIIIILLTLKWSVDSNTVNYISFGATLTSLFLGLIAIFYSIVANNNLSESFTKLSDTSSNLSTASISLITNADNLKTLLSQLPILEGKIDESNNILKIIKEKNEENLLDSSTNTKDKPITTNATLTKETIDMILRKSSLYGLFSLYLCQKSFSTKKAFNLNDLLKTFGESFYSLYFYGYIVAIGCTEIIKVNISDNIFNIYHVDKNAEELIEKYLIEKIDGQGDMKSHYADLKDQIYNHFL
ncbi:hypothetical protein [Leptospira brenneri]|uniref:hypothetical protein n=1 Tax=Leptospira brenneri TaxID=2023182 RepID=UPI000C2B3E5F|nr:hypothetical protein [Leptospira brenneri]PJZ43778.1 hypothetical protein CH361_18675 [Leptospira brenneri]